MIISYSQIIDSNILAINEQKSVGTVSEVVLQKTDLKIKAVVTNSPLFFLPKRVLTFDDIIDFDQHAIVTQSEDNIVKLAEVVSIAKAIKAKCLGVGQKVITQSGTVVGKVYDFTIDSDSGLIYSLYVKRFLTDKIIPRSIILELKNNCYIIENDYELIKDGSPAPETA